MTGPGGGETSRRRHGVGARGWRHRVSQANRTVGSVLQTVGIHERTVSGSGQTHIFILCFLRLLYESHLQGGEQGGKLDSATEE